MNTPHRFIEFVKEITGMSDAEIESFRVYFRDNLILAKESPFDSGGSSVEPFLDEGFHGA